ncbi:MAG: hypothetical protein HYU75_16605 [Betaproteobacteria bacterium]|nr:hypothetical protein [Betaproteobacteria bacterium]
MSNLDARVAELAARYRPLAAEMLKEAIRIPADYVDRPPDEGGDARCGLSNHEFPRLEYLRKKIIEIKAVRRAEDVFFDDFGNLAWVALDPEDGIAPGEKKVICLDGHSDTVRALRAQWREKAGGGLDAYEGLVDATKLDRSFLKKELGWLPPEAEWEHLVFGRGSADQLGGVIAEVLATKILLELAPEGALKGAIVRAYATVAEEDNDGGGPMFIMRKLLPGAKPELVPDVVILTEGTGCSKKGALGIYRGQRGRMQIEVTVKGRSCHGSMPWEGLNPRLDAMGGPQSARVRRRHHQGGGREVREARGLPRQRVPGPRHAHRLLGESRDAERLRRARALRLPLRPAAHGG